MNLALILLLALSDIVSLPQSQSASPPVTQESPQQPSTDSKPQDQTGGSQPQDSSTASKPTAPAPTQTPSTQQAAPKKKRRHKKVISQNCDPATGAATAADPSAGSTAAAGAQSAPAKCPPPKIIVRHGGASEPAIQLAGDQPSASRDAIKQMLGATDANLKKLTDHQLNTNQQDMVNQVRQFMQQSHTAVDAGDFERARTLAWKAQLLSEELVKPAK